VREFGSGPEQGSEEEHPANLPGVGRTEHECGGNKKRHEPADHARQRHRENACGLEVRPERQDGEQPQRQVNRDRHGTDRKHADATDADGPPRPSDDRRPVELGKGRPVHEPSVEVGDPCVKGRWDEMARRRPYHAPLASLGLPLDSAD
jgi:hypothetical protein